MMLLVNVLVMIWQGFVVYGVGPDMTWVMSLLGLRRRETGGPRRVIDYGNDRYTDDPEDSRDQQAGTPVGRDI